MKTPAPATRTADARAAFTQEMVPFSDALMTYALYLTNDQEQANDLLQDTYLKAFRYYNKFESGTNARAWLYRIMKNTFINEYRRVQRLPSLVEYDEHISSYKMSGAQLNVGPEEILDAADSDMFGDEVSGAIAALPEKFKSVIVLRDVQDLPYEEIASALKIPIGTVRSRLHRARSILFDKLKEYARSRGMVVGESFQGAELAFAG
jgi:RNA polymerase sigma factor (sigma-70 family)